MTSYKQLAFSLNLKVIKQKKEIERFGEKNKRWKHKIQKLKIQEEQLKIERKNVNLEIQAKSLEKDKFYKMNNSLSLTTGDLIYFRYEKKIDFDSGGFGFVHKETINHLSILIYDTKNEKCYKYSIRKDMIKGIKHFRDKINHNKNYDEVLELYNNEKKGGSK